MGPPTVRAAPLVEDLKALKECKPKALDLAGSTTALCTVVNEARVQGPLLVISEVWGVLALSQEHSLTPVTQVSYFFRGLQPAAKKLQVERTSGSNPHPDSLFQTSQSQYHNCFSTIKQYLN